VRIGGKRNYLTCASAPLADCVQLVSGAHARLTDASRELSFPFGLLRKEHPMAQGMV
jgi:hypothetical protein